MGRELRCVPSNWEHPKNKSGNYIPMHEEFPYNKGEIREGLADGWLEGDPPYYDVDVMPQWDEEEKTHFQMYEDTTEGTPISPVMDSIVELAHWLADNGVSAFGSLTATYEQWLATCKSGHAVSAAWNPKIGLISGVEFEGLHDS